MKELEKTFDRVINMFRVVWLKHDPMGSHSHTN